MAISTRKIAFRIWSGTLLMVFIICAGMAMVDSSDYWWFLLIVAIGSAIAGLPALFLLWWVLPRIRRRRVSFKNKMVRLGVVALFTAIVYGTAINLCFDFAMWHGALFAVVVIPLLLFACSLYGIWLWSKAVRNYLTTV